MSPNLKHCRDEQARCRDHLLNIGWDDGAALGLADWMMEELLIDEELSREPHFSLDSARKIG